MSIDETLVHAIRAGVRPADFWDMTYRELYAVFSAFKRALRHEHRIAILTGFTAGQVSQAKKPTPDLLRKMLRPYDEPTPPMTPRQLRAAVMGINRAMGGKVTIRKKAA